MDSMKWLKLEINLHSISVNRFLFLAFFLSFFSFPHSFVLSHFPSSRLIFTTDQKKPGSLSWKIFNQKFNFVEKNLRFLFFSFFWGSGTGIDFFFFFFFLGQSNP